LLYAGAVPVDAEEPTEVVEREVHVDASPAEVWEAFADPALLTEWFGGDATLEPSGGGRGRFVEGDEVRLAEVTVAVPGRRLAWRWWPLGSDRGRAGRVEVDLVPVGGGTDVVVREAAPVARVPVGASASAGGGWSAPRPVDVPQAWHAPRLARLAAVRG
jgi:uncharacterized protein YndB with AHSA1/START domain